MFTLALRLHRTVGELGSTMTAREAMMWAVFLGMSETGAGEAPPEASDDGLAAGLAQLDAFLDAAPVVGGVDGG
jgi:hypothetical protein